MNPCVLLSFKKWEILYEKTLLFSLVCLMILLAACTSSRGKCAIDLIRESAVAKMELPDGSYTYFDSEIATLHSFAGLCLQTSPFEPADNEQDWLYRIVFKPVEKVKYEDEIIVTFH